MSDAVEEPKPVNEAIEEASAEESQPTNAQSEEQPSGDGECAAADKEQDDESGSKAEDSAAVGNANDSGNGTVEADASKVTETNETTAEPEPEPIEIPSGNGELVLVTGATGYLASHIVKLLADGGEYRVRGTVRCLEDNEKLDTLKSLVENAKYTPEFVEADLMKPESWTDAVKGCQYVLHVASPFPTTQPTDPSEVINPAKEGTLSVLKACADSGTVRRVVITSSCAAIYSGRPVVKDMLTEEEWADVPKTCTPYAQSKTIAEQAAWDFMKELPEDCHLELAVVNPGLITGPPLMKMDSTSIEIIKKLMHRELPMLPKLSFPIIDVRDVALAHLRAMVIKQAAGKRHIVATSTYWMKDIANYLSQEFNSKGFNVTTTQAPYVLIWFQSHFNTDVRQLLPEIGKIYHFDNARMKKVLLIDPRAAKDSVIEMAHALVNFGIVQKVEKPEKKSRKLTFRKKKAVKEEDEEKKDEPEKIKDNGSAENEPVSPEEANPDEVKVELSDTAKEEAPSAEAAEETKEEALPSAVVEDADKIEAMSSEEEVKEETADPESTKSKDKGDKKSKKEKKKGGIFSAFSFKSKNKKQVESKVEEKPAEGETSAEPAAEESEKPDDVVAAAEETAACLAEIPATAEESSGKAAVAAEEELAATKEEHETAEEAPAATEETPAATEETPAAEEAPKTTDETPTTTVIATPEVEQDDPPPSE